MKIKAATEAAGEGRGIRFFIARDQDRIR